MEFRWRGRFNEDTDLSLSTMKAGYCTVLFNAFLIEKKTTMKVKGGNTDTIYNNDSNRMDFAKSLQEQHPDVVDVTWKFGRWHHQVNYNVFKTNRLQRKKGLKIPQGDNEFGMELKRA